MSKEGKVLDMAGAKPKGVTVRIREDVHAEVEQTIFEATGLRINMTDFITQAVDEKLEPYREMVRKKRAAESKNGKKEAS